MRMGIICPSEIAFRRFMPALKKCQEIEFAGIGVYSKEERFGTVDVDVSIFEKLYNAEVEKARKFIKLYGGKIYSSYAEITSDPGIDALYIPLPPALHFKWAKQALEYGKHVLVEKPATLSVEDSKELIKIASEKNLALHENYMFVFHSQLSAIDSFVNSGEIGDIRLYRICFGFPRRATNDFRYNKELGGGALIDAGGYTIRYANMLLGDTARIIGAQLNYIDEFEVDIYGSGMLVNNDGLTAQIAFGMDNNYKCELEVWGSKGCLTTGRVLTAPDGFVPEAIIKKGDQTLSVKLPADDSFLKSINHFISCVKEESVRNKTYKMIYKQAELIEEFKKMSEIL